MNTKELIESDKSPDEIVDSMSEPGRGGHPARRSRFRRAGSNKSDRLEKELSRYRFSDSEVEEVIRDFEGAYKSDLIEFHKALTKGRLKYSKKMLDALADVLPEIA